MSKESIKVAGELGALGLDSMRFLETKDDFERHLMLVLAKEIGEARAALDENLATAIANKVGQLIK